MPLGPKELHGCFQWKSYLFSREWRRARTKWCHTQTSHSWCFLFFSSCPGWSTCNVLFPFSNYNNGVTRYPVLRQTGGGWETTMQFCGAYIMTSLKHQQYLTGSPLPRYIYSSNTCSSFTCAVQGGFQYDNTAPQRFFWVLKFRAHSSYVQVTNATSFFAWMQILDLNVAL